MNLAGALFAAVAVTALVLGLRGSSPVDRYLDLVAPRRIRTPSRLSPVSATELRQAGLSVGPEELLAYKIGCALAAAVLSAALGPILSIGPVVVLAAGYAGWTLPSIVVARRATSALRAAERSTVALIERLSALMAAGRPAESALAALLPRATGSRLLDLTLHDVSSAYMLGAPLFRTLARHATLDGLVTCAAVAADLERARDLGTGSVAIVRERRSALRDLERSRALEAASKVEGKLMLVLVLCYLPALMLIAVIPLFMSLLEGLGM